MNRSDWVFLSCMWIVTVVVIVFVMIHTADVNNWTSQKMLKGELHEKEN